MKNIITKIILLLSVSILFADDLIVDKNSLNQYEQDNYAYFNAFNFHGEYQGNNAKNPPLPNSISDRINLPETIPILGNQFGKQIASGMYFYRMETPGFQSVKKLIFLK